MPYSLIPCRRPRRLPATPGRLECWGSGVSLDSSRKRASSSDPGLSSYELAQRQRGPAVVLHLAGLESAWCSLGYSHFLARPGPRHYCHFSEGAYPAQANVRDFLTTIHDCCRLLVCSSEISLLQTFKREFKDIFANIFRLPRTIKQIVSIYVLRIIIIPT